MVQKEAGATTQSGFNLASIKAIDSRSTAKISGLAYRPVVLAGKLVIMVEYFSLFHAGPHEQCKPARTSLKSFKF